MNSNNVKRMSANVVSQILAFAINLGINFFLTPFVIKNIGTSVYGFVGLANNFTSYLSVFTVALTSMLNRYCTIEISKNNYEKANEYYTSVTVATSVFSALMSIPIAVVIIKMDSFLDVPLEASVDIKVLWAFIMGMFLLNLVTSPLKVATYSKNRLDLDAFRNMESYLIRAVFLIVVFLILKPHVWYIGAATFIAGIYTIICQYVYKNKLTPQLKLSRKSVSISAIRELFGIGMWNSVRQLNEILMTGLDLLITNIFINAQVMGLYSTAKLIPAQILTLVSMIGATFAPQMTISFAKDNREGFLDNVRWSVKVCGIICSVPVMGFLVFGKPFYSLWLSSLSESDITMIYILSILTMLPEIFTCYVFPLYTINTITCKIRIPVLLNIVLGVFNIVIVMFLLKFTSLGVYAVAMVSSVLSIFRIFIFTPIYAAKVLNKPWGIFYKVLFRGSFSNLIIGLAYIVLNRCFDINSWGRLIIVCVLAGVIGYIINFIIILNKEEKRGFVCYLKEHMPSKTKDHKTK
jgi:O-antigen/teichoic acid export membrane protein